MKTVLGHVGADAEHGPDDRVGDVVAQVDESNQNLLIGAQWLWNQAQMHFPKATQILDLWHALERLWEVARAALGAGKDGTDKDGAGKDEAQTWVEAQKQRLEAGELDAFLLALRDLQARHPDCAEIGEALTYYTNNRCRMDYGQYRKWGLDVGSGAAESGCKQIISQRLKGAGMRWREAGASAIARLRCLLLSGQWDEIANFWDAPKLPRLCPKTLLAC